VGIVNGRIEASSYKWYSRFRWFISGLLEQVDTLFAQSDEYAERFIMLGVKGDAVHVVGNIKGHIRIQRPQKKEWLAVRRRLNIGEEAFVVTAGCIHAGEGAALRTFFTKMEQQGYACKLIVVPRYCEEATAVVDEIGGKVLHLDTTTTSRQWEICVIEKVGILDDMYMAADAAIIGGTFVDIGGHSLWDAACFGIPVFFGPNSHTQKESRTLLHEAGVGFPVADAEELARTMFKVVKEKPMPFLKAQQRFIEATNKTRSIVEPLLP
jgi:3-deoxy-D-manno-octulosonic-acid transferase